MPADSYRRHAAQRNHQPPEQGFNGINVISLLTLFSLSLTLSISLYLSCPSPSLCSQWQQNSPLSLPLSCLIMRNTTCYRCLLPVTEGFRLPHQWHSGDSFASPTDILCLVSLPLYVSLRAPIETKFHAIVLSFDSGLWALINHHTPCAPIVVSLIPMRGVYVHIL